jgi:hypothetical protein
MKTSILSLFALPALFLGSFAAPASNVGDVEKRQISDAYSIVESLYSEIQQYTGAISKLPLLTYGHWPEPIEDKHPKSALSRDGKSTQEHASNMPSQTQRPPA